jgi:hypothetical protein
LIGLPKRSLIERSSRAGEKDTVNHIFEFGHVDVEQRVSRNDLYIRQEKRRIEPRVCDPSRHVAPGYANLVQNLTML